MQGLTYDAASDILYANTVSSRGIQFLGSSLYAIDRVTGTGTWIRSFNVPLYALAFDNSTNTLYGAPGLGNVGPPPGGGFTHALYRLDPTTGAATPVMSSNFTYVSLAFDPVSHVLYGASSNPEKLVRIDLSTRQETPIADLALSGISFNPETGTLYATTYGSSPSPPKGLYTVDLATGTAALVGPLTMNSPSDLAFVIPEPGSVLLLAVGALILLEGGWNRKRRNIHAPESPSASERRFGGRC